MPTFEEKLEKIYDDTQFIYQNGICKIDLQQFKNAIKNLIKEENKQMKQDIRSVLSMVQGTTTRVKIANFIKEYLLKPSRGGN